MKRLRRFLTYRLTYFGAVILMVLAGALPRRAGWRLFGWLGMLAYVLLARSRRIAFANLRFIYGGRLPDKEIRRIALGAFANLGRFGYDTARFGWLSRQGIRGLVSGAQMGRLEAAIARGKGVIAITGHVGNWELLAAFISAMGYRVNVLASRMKDARLNALVVGLRQAVDLVVLERSTGLKDALRALRRGEILGLLIDQDTAVDSVVVDFLGRPAKTAVGPVKLAKQTGATILPMAVLANPDGTYRLEIGEAVAVNGDGASLEEDVAKCSKAVEAFISSEPEQWVWMHKRWKSVASDIYS